MRLPGARAWADDPPWATVYDWSVEHPLVGGLGWRAAVGSDLRRLYDAAAEIGTLPAGSVVLDVPCGGGVALRGLRRGQSMACFSPPTSPRRCWSAPWRPPARAGWPSRSVPRLADVGALPLADGSVDLVVTFTGLHCFPDPRRAVAEMARVLRSGGVVTGSMLATDTGARYEPRAPSRPAGAPARADVLARRAWCAWFAADGVPGPAGARRAAPSPTSEE